ncbi:sulfatase-like hydrolase/transferase [Elizabethkingia anophelis]|uniref:sulfatase-like hydrolase/transferase n=1 Tax=Elizabethkingia anophelis TaxID=1117645 RepID=UPI0004E3260C|nr:sulfatase-like hydrolase/transferase [Elizabethkingia anophelis]KFC35848.1 sulfatase [Elizabethkingia anophelis]MCT3787610.1 sulfatase-like hydrolase/transferase [Elizabethkingia anophelis]MDV3501339.1 sulfatase [Elizabethkingia anophelis]
MNKFLKLFILLFIPCSLAAQAVKKPSKPNIIFILVDDLGYGDIGILNQNQRKKEGKPYIATPFLDKLASQGAILTQSYSNAPVCAPSRASLLTGRTQGHSEVRDNQFDKALEDNYTIGNTLQKVGYTTIAIGKWGLQGTDANWSSHPLKRGFDEYYGYIRHSDGHEHYPKEGKYRGKKEVYDNYSNVAENLDKSYTGDLWTARAKYWITQHNQNQKDKPFFMYLAYDTPHAVIELPTQEYPKGKGLHGGLQWLGKKGQMINTASGEIDSWYAPEYANATYKTNDGSEKPWTDVYKRYATVIQRLDAQIGDLLQLLKDLKIDQNTLVVFSSDNGPSQESYLKETYTPEFFDGYGPFDGIKRDLWEGGERMPVFVQWSSKIAPGQKIDLPNMLSDWMPTFLDAAGATAPQRADGISILPILTGMARQQKDPIVYAEYFEEGHTPNYTDFEVQRRKRTRGQMQLVRFGKYSGVRYNIKDAQDNFEIYNVVTDPKQKTDLAASMPSLQQNMKDFVLQIRRPDSSAVRPYDKAYIPGISHKSAKKGIQWHSYQAKSPWIPDTNNLKPLNNGTLTTPIIINKSIKGNVITIKGVLNIPQNANYTFYLKAFGKAFLRIHKTALIDADYNYNSGTEKRADILLRAGLHPFTLTYKKPEKDIDAKGFIFEWSSENFNRKAFTTGDFY